jgi:hypothetical protein
LASRDHDADWTRRVAGSGRALSRGHLAHQEKPHYETGSLGSGTESRKEGNDWEMRELSPTSEFGLLMESADETVKGEERAETYACISERKHDEEAEGKKP